MILGAMIEYSSITQHIVGNPENSELGLDQNKTGKRNIVRRC